MSNKSRLQTNNTNLQALIDKANALPDAGSGGSGGSVETCTVTINKTGAFSVIAYYNTLEDTVVGTNVSSPGPMSLTIECIKGGVLYLYCPGGDVTYNSLTIDGDATLLYGATYGQYLCAGLMVSNNANSAIITIAATPLYG